MKILINYADEKYKKTQKFNTWTGLNIAKFDKIYSFGPEDIEQKFFVDNKRIFSEKRGNGLWLWKPYFIDKIISESQEGDIIFYCDSGSFFIKNIQNLINSMSKNEKIWVSDIPLLEVCFTKPKCFEMMNCNIDEVKYSNQIQGTFFMAECCEESKKFVKKWLEYCQNYELISPEGNLQGADSKGNQFIAHREDQSILSLLCKINDIKPHLDPSQRGKYQEAYYSTRYTFKETQHADIYKPVLFLHKSATVNPIVCLKLIIKMFLNRKKYRKGLFESLTTN